MNQREPLYADVLTQEEMEASRTRTENDQAMMLYSFNQLSHLPVVPHASYQDIPLQHFRLANARPATRPLGLNLSMPPTIPAQRLSGIVDINQSLSSKIRVNEMEMQCFNGTYLGAEGGYDPFLNQRKTTRGFNGLPRSKSVRHGIDRRFLRNEASCNTRSGDIGQELLRYNTMACISDIPLLASTRCNARVEAFHSSSSRRQSCEENMGELPHTEAPPDGGERLYDNVQLRTDACRSQDIAVKLSDSASDVSEVSQGGDNCKTCFFLGLIAFVASLGGAAVYSLIGCAMVGCKV